MRKWAGIGALTAILAAGGLYGMGTVEPAEASPSTGAKPAVIGYAKAKQYALAAVGGQGTVDSIELERSSGILYYEVEIEQGRHDQEVRIEAYTGRTLEIRSDDDHDGDEDDREDRRIGYAGQSSTGTAQSPSKKAVITADQAVAAAKAEAGGTLHQVKLDREDGRLVYEVELRVQGQEVELEIDAYTGNILKVEKDDDDN